MKKSLLLTSILGVFIFCYGCHQKQTATTTEATIVVKDTPSSSVLASDTMKVANQNISEKIINESGKQKDTVGKTNKGNAIIHKAPEQEKIDSIKNAKQKGKK